MSALLHVSMFSNSLLTVFVWQGRVRPHPPTRRYQDTPPAREAVGISGRSHVKFTEVLCSLGDVDPETVLKVEVEVSDQEKARMDRIANRPPLSEILNLHDFEVCPTSTYSHSRILTSGFRQLRERSCRRRHGRTTARQPTTRSRTGRITPRTTGYGGGHASCATSQTWTGRQRYSATRRRCHCILYVTTLHMWTRLCADHADRLRPHWASLGTQTAS